MCRRTEEEVGPTVGLPCHRHFVGFFNVPVLATTRDHPFYTVIPTHRPIQSPFTITLGIRRTHSRLNPPGPHGGAALVEDEVTAIQRNRWVVGTIALHYTLPQSRELEREMLAAACRVLQPCHVLLVELRGIPSETLGIVPVMDLLEILFDSGVGSRQPIVIRESPIGRQAIIQLESSRRNFYYAVSAAGSFWHFNFEDSMLRMPRRSILLESSSPNYASGGAPLQGMRPKFLAGVLRYISQTLDMNVYDAQDMVNRNFERCFGRYFPL